MSFVLEPASDPLSSAESGLDQPIASVLVLLLLGHEVVDDFVLLLHFDLKHMQTSAQTSIVNIEVVGRHFLLHNIVEEALTFLLDDFGTKLGDAL